MEPARRLTTSGLPSGWESTSDGPSAQALASFGQATMASADPSAQDRAVAQQALNQAGQIATLDDDHQPAPTNRAGRASNTGLLFDIAG